MEIKEVDSPALRELQELKLEINANSNVAANSTLTDQVEISERARELQGTHDTVKIAKQLLSLLPSARAEVVYHALAKLKAGLYASDEILSETAAKLVSRKARTHY